MDCGALYQQFVSGILQTTWIEFVAVLFGLSGSLLARKGSVLTYPAMATSALMFIYLCFSAGLFAEASVNVYYVVVSIIGFMAWWREGQQKFVVTRCTREMNLLSIVFFLTAWLILFLFLKTFTSSTIPVGDSLAAALTYTAMWLMTRKKLESWIWWMATNIATAPLYFVKGLVFTSFEYVVFLGLAIIGYTEWRRKSLLALTSQPLNK